MKAMSIKPATNQQSIHQLLPWGRYFLMSMFALILLSSAATAQGVGISESSITPDGSAILELRSTTRGFLMPRNSSTLGFSVQGLSFYNTSTNRFNFHTGSGWMEIPTKSDNLSVFASTTSAQLRGILSDPTGTGSAVFANTPTLVTPVLGAATGTSLALGGGTALTTTNQTGTGNLVLDNTPTLVTPVLGAATGTSLALGGGTALTTTNQTGTGNLVLANTPTLVTPVLGAATGTSLALGGGTALTTTNQTGTGSLVLATGPAFTGFSSTGAAVNINASSNFATNINTGTSAAAVTIGNTTGTTGVSINTAAAVDAITTLGTTGSQVFASSTTNSDKIAIQPQSTTATAAFEGTITSDNLTATRTWTFPDADGRIALSRNNCSTADQTINAATTALLTGSTIAIPSTNLRVGTVFKYRVTLSKTAFGTAANTFLFKIGTNGTTADPTILTFAMPVGTAVADVGQIDITITIRGPLGAACIAQGHFSLNHNLAATGLSTIGVNINATSAGFNSTTANLIASLSCTTAAATVLTFQQVIVEAINL
jgi:hypothetical protein